MLVCVGGRSGAPCSKGKKNNSRLLPNGQRRSLSFECGRLKFCSRSPSGRLNMEFSFPSDLSDDFNLLKKLVKKSFTQ